MCPRQYNLGRDLVVDVIDTRGAGIGKLRSSTSLSYCSSQSICVQPRCLVLLFAVAEKFYAYISLAPPPSTYLTGGLPLRAAMLIV